MVAIVLEEIAGDGGNLVLYGRIISYPEGKFAGHAVYFLVVSSHVEVRVVVLCQQQCTGDKVAFFLLVHFTDQPLLDTPAVDLGSCRLEFL